MKHSHLVRVTRLSHPNESNFAFAFAFAFGFRLSHPNEFNFAFAFAFGFRLSNPKESIFQKHHLVKINFRNLLIPIKAIEPG